MKRHPEGTRTMEIIVGQDKGRWPKGTRVKVLEYVKLTEYGVKAYYVTTMSK